MATRPKVTSGPPMWVREMISSIVLTFLGATGLMLAVAFIHETWIPAVPTLGYWDAFWIFLMVDVTVNSLLFGARVKVMD